MATVNLFGDLALDASVQETNDKIDALTAVRDTAAAADQKGIASFAIRRDSDTIPIGDGDMGFLALDEEGRLKTSNKTASFALTSGAINAVGNTLVVDTRRASNVVFHVKNTGTGVATTAGTYVFEASIDSTNGTDGTWFSIQAVRSNSSNIETTNGALALSPGAGLAYSWEASVNAYQFMRIRCTVAILPATANAVWTVQRGSYATEPIPAAQASVASQAVTLASTTANIGTITAGTNYTLVTAATTNAGNIRTTVGNLYELSISNPTATPAFVKLYSKATPPTVGTDIPIVTIPAAANSFQAYAFGSTGKRVLLGIGIAVTAAAAATDTAATVAGIQITATTT